MTPQYNPFRSFAILFVVFACFATATFAQGLGSITGTVVDPSHASVGAASVVLTLVKTGAASTQVTRPDGLFVFPSVAPDEYKLDITAKGFKKYEQAGITVLADQSLTLNVALLIGSEQVTVNVEANAA